MANTSISGLVSGLDTATIIDQLMQIEAQPQTDLKTKLTTQQTTLTSLKGLNGKIAALTTQAKALTGATWQPLTATSSSTAVSATATSGTAAGSFDVTVVATAATHKLTYASTAASTDHVTGASNDVVVTIGGTSQTLTTDGTLAGLVSALNAGGTGVKASTVKLDDGTQRLLVQASTSGAAAAFTLTAADGSDLLGGAAVQAGTDAAITIGQDTLHSSTNTFADVISGVGLTISSAAVGSTVSINVASDSTKVAATMKSLVDAVNATLNSIDALTTFDPTGKTTGPLAGDSTIAALRNSLLDAVYPSDGTSLAKYGLQTDRNGQLVLDQDAFAKAYAADPAGLSTAMGAQTNADGTTGFAGRIATVGKGASDTFTGTLTSAITGNSSTIKQLQDSIDDWDTRLALRRTTLNQQYTALETALSQMNSQSSWLASQISSLSSGS